jgi:ribosomal protein S18 acetylase RimI-like enzyme
VGIVDLRGRAHEAAVVELLAMAQIHRQPKDALALAPSIASEYAASLTLRQWGYELDGAIAGIVGAEPVPPSSAFIRDLAVAPQARRRGIGRALIEFLRSEQGYTSLEGDTLEAVLPFYEACGFRVVADGLMADGVMRYHFVWPPS